MSNNSQHGSPGAPHLSYSTPATGRRSSYASVAAGTSSAPLSAHENVPASFGSVRGLSIGSAPSAHLQRIATSEHAARTHQSTSDADSQADGLVHVPSTWGRGSSSMANYASLRHGSQVNGMGSGGKEQDKFFIPSYLRGSRYIEKLEAAHEAKIAAQHAESTTRTFNAGSLSSSSSSVNLQKMAPSHRGMTYDIIENHLHSEDDGPAPLPSKWKTKDKWGGLEIMPSETDVRFVGGNKLSDHEAAAARTDHPMPSECGIYYYEVTIIHKGKDGMIGIGFSGSKASLEKLPGWEPDSWGYHGDDGMSFCCQSTGRPYAERFTTGDVIGCGVDFATSQGFFTKNGVFLGKCYAFKEIRNIKLYPSVGMKKPQAHVDVNFGQRPFSFDIDGHDKKKSIKAEIDAAKTDSLHPDLTKGELSQALVAQYLSHDGYNETAKAFSQEIRSENQALLGTVHSPLDTYLVAEKDQDAAHRQTIRSAILDGQIDEAIDLINDFYPSILEANPSIYFQLKCRKFIELMREISEHNNELNAPDSFKAKRSKRFVVNGHHSIAHSDDGFEPEMDLDDPPLDIKQDASNDYDKMDTEDGSGAPDPESINDRHQELLKEAVLYGKELKQHFKADQSQMVTETMTKIFGMIAYKDPSQSDQAYLLDKSQRGPVAEAVNSVILVFLGKPSSTALERLYKQTHVLVEMISEDGGVGSFVNVKSVLKSVDDALRDSDMANYIPSGALPVGFSQEIDP